MHFTIQPHFSHKTRGGTNSVVEQAEHLSAIRLMYSGLSPSPTANGERKTRGVHAVIPRIFLLGKNHSLNCIAFEPLIC